MSEAVPDRGGHSVVDGVIQSISPSQIATFDTDQFGGCQRRWYFEKILGKKTKETKNQAVGTECHSQFEHWLSTGEDVLGKIARAAKWLLPVPGPDLRVEWGLNNCPRPPNDPATGKAVNWYPPNESLVTAAGIPLIGFGDVFNFRGEYVSPQGELLADPEGTVEYIDHKTTSSTKWMKTAEQLIRTAQMPGYGEFLRRLVPGLRYVRLSHVYSLTDGAPFARKVTALVTVEAIQERWKEIDGVVRCMPQVAAAKRVEDVPGYEPSCSAFRGCPHKSICPMKRNPRSRLLMSFISAKVAAGAKLAIVPPPGKATTPPPPGKAQVAPVVESAPETVGFACQAIQGQPYVVDGVSTIFVCRTNGKFSFAPVGEGMPILKNPGDPITPGAAPAVEVVNEPEAEGASEAAGAAIDAVTQAATPPKRGRPSKAEQAARAAASAAAEAEALGAPQEGATLSLYVGCIPNFPYTLLDVYVAERVAEVSKSFDTIDPRVTQSNDEPLAFGRWKAVLGEAVRQTPPAPGPYVAFGFSDLTNAVVDALIPLCSVVVRGVR